MMAVERAARAAAWIRSAALRRAAALVGAAALFGAMTLLGATTLLGAPSPATPATEVDKYLNGLSSWAADFTQTIDDGHGNVVRSAAGRLFLQRPGKFRWDYRQPSEQLILPPESASSPAGDVWSLGMTLVEVTSQRLPAWNRNAMGDPRAPENLPAPLLDIARHSLRRDPVQRWTIREISERLTRAEAAQRIESPVARNASAGNRRYLIAALILFLASMGFVSLKLLNHSSRGDARVPAAAPKLAKKTLPEPKPAAVAAPPEKKTAAPVEERRASSVAPKPIVASPVQAPKIPQAAVASSGVIHQVLPVAAQKSLDTIRGTVRVAIKVSVDSSGNVSDATIDSQGPSAYFANLALEAARKWKFAPAHGGPDERTIHFEFSPDGVKASAAQSASE